MADDERHQRENIFTAFAETLRVPALLKSLESCLEDYPSGGWPLDRVLCYR